MPRAPAQGNRPSGPNAYDPALRERAAKALAEEGSVRAAAKKLGLSPKRVWELAREYQEGHRGT